MMDFRTQAITRCSEAMGAGMETGSTVTRDTSTLSVSDWYMAWIAGALSP